MDTENQLKPYPEYKDSGVSWLVNIPTHWKIERAKWFIQMGRPVRPEDEVVTCFRDGVVTLRKNRRLEGFTESIKEIGYQGVRNGDLIIHGMDAFAGAIGVSDSDGKCTPVYSICQPRNDDNPHYFAFIVREMARRNWIAALSKGIRERSTDFRFQGFAAQFLPLPPKDEQAAIVKFLDKKLTVINKYIASKKKLIKLLEEQKQAIINQAVTRGLDPNVRLKPSGVEWLGDVPEHWEVLRVKQCARKISKGTTPSTEGREILESGPIRFIKAENIFSGLITSRPMFFIDNRTHELLKRSQLLKNDVLFVIAGATIGKTAVVIEKHLPANTNQAVAFIRPNKRVDTKYLHLWLGSPLIKELTWLDAVQSAQPNLSMADLGNFDILLPNLKEQAEIMSKLEESLGPLYSVEASIRKHIDLIQEYRTRLIADVVTGKVDVRDAAKSLPEVIFEPVELEDVDEENRMEYSDISVENKGEVDE